MAATQKVLDHEVFFRDRINKLLVVGEGKIIDREFPFRHRNNMLFSGWGRNNSRSRICLSRSNKYAILDSLKLVEDRYLITAGIDHKIRIWNTDTDRVISKLNVH